MPHHHQRIGADLRMVILQVYWLYNLEQDYSPPIHVEPGGPGAPHPLRRIGEWPGVERVER